VAGLNPKQLAVIALVALAVVAASNKIRWINRLVR